MYLSTFDIAGSSFSLRVVIRDVKHQIVHTQGSKRRVYTRVCLYTLNTPSYTSDVLVMLASAEQQPLKCECVVVI